MEKEPSPATAHNHQTPSRFWIIGLAIVLLYMLPYFVLGENSYIRIHDTLDSEISKYKLLVESGKLFAPNDALLPGMMDGAYRISFPSEFNALVWLFYFFGPFWGYVANSLILRVIAFFGMFLLLERHVFKQESSSLAVIGASMGFALLPFWSMGALSVAAQPLVLYALLNLFEGDARPRNWLILALVPFYSFVEFSGIFWIAAALILAGVEAWRKRIIPWKSLGGAAVLLMGSLISQYRLFYGMLFDHAYVSHRVEFQWDYVGFLQALKIALGNFLRGQDHVSTVHALILIIALGALVVLRGSRRRQLALWIGAAASISAWYGLWHWQGLQPLTENVSLLKSFNFSRVHWFHPTIWYVIFALALYAIHRHLRWGRPLALLIISSQVALLFASGEQATGAITKQPSYRAYFSPTVFEEIADYIGVEQSNYRVVSIGMNPAIPNYSGFHTLDAYLNNYPLAFKHKFRPVIAEELKKSADLLHYFDKWGNRCYMFSSELGLRLDVYKDSGLQITRLDVKTDVLAGLGVEYVLSAVPILNASDLQLRYRKEFTRDGSPWHVYLYEVAPKTPQAILPDTTSHSPTRTSESRLTARS
ncbi:hypothetical protein D3C86_543200 [compost metagenome]